MGLKRQIQLQEVINNDKKKKCRNDWSQSNGQRTRLNLLKKKNNDNKINKKKRRKNKRAASSEKVPLNLCKMQRF